MLEAPHADVLLLAAGLGNRLKPITDKIPKPLVQVGGKALIEWNLELLAASGFRRVFINTHYLPELIRKFVGDGTRWNIAVEYSHEPVLLDTGGAIKNIEARLKQQLLVTVNSDILLGRDFSLAALIAKHLAAQTPPLVTMVLRDDPEREKFGEIGIAEDGSVCSYLGTAYGAKPVRRLMYSGVQVMSTSVISRMPPKGTVFSITRDTHVSILKHGGLIQSTIYEGYWNDIGTPERLNRASKDISEGRFR